MKRLRWQVAQAREQTHAETADGREDSAAECEFRSETGLRTTQPERQEREKGPCWESRDYTPTSDTQERLKKEELTGDIQGPREQSTRTDCRGEEATLRALGSGRSTVPAPTDGPRRKQTQGKPRQKRDRKAQTALGWGVTRTKVDTRGARSGQVRKL